MSAPWHLGRMVALDFEASDKIPATARIVTCALIGVGGGQPTEKRTWLLNPGIPMNPEAIKVHGITDEYAAEHGQSAAEGVYEIADAVADVVRAGLPLVGHNLGGYDLNLLGAECARHGLGSIEAVCGQPFTRVIDTMVIDRHVAPFRSKVSETQGPYQLQTSVETYGLTWDEGAAHDAEYDAMQSARVAYRVGDIAHRPADQRPTWVCNRRDRGASFDHLADVSLEELFVRQQGWHRQWAVDFQAYLRRSKPDATVSAEWPLQGAGGAA
jgi:DNA polymerase III epsilon subunit-like protein